MTSRIACATAIAARPDPRRAASRRYIAPKYVWVLPADFAASTDAVRSHGDPFRVRPLRCVPTLSCWPGLNPAHEAKWSALGKRHMSAPTSASTTSAVCRPIPVTLSRCSIASAIGAERTPISASSVASNCTDCAMCVNCCATRNCRCGPTGLVTNAYNLQNQLVHVCGPSTTSSYVYDG